MLVGCADRNKTPAEDLVQILQESFAVVRNLRRTLAARVDAQSQTKMVEIFN